MNARRCLLRVVVTVLCAFVSATHSHACNWTSIQGSWRSLGYNRMLQIASNEFTLYHVTAISRIAVERRERPHFEQRYDRLRCDGPGRLTIFERGGNTPYTFIRSRDTPALRIDQSEPAAMLRDPLSNFAVFWQYFHENYAFFRAGPVAVDWAHIGELARSGLTQRSSREELRAAFESAIRPLRDGHVLVSDGDQVIANSLPLEERRFITGFAREAGLDPATTARHEISRRFQAAAWQYADPISPNGDLEPLPHERLRAGWLTDEVGYVAPLSFAGLSGENATAAEDLSALHAVMQGVIGEFSRAKGIVIDLRFNGGGYDSVALEFAGYFTDRERHAYTKRVWYSGQIVSETRIMLKPSTPKPFLGPLAVLVSDSTASGAEIALLALRELPTRLFIGQPSMGVFSDTLQSKLPNGWLVTLSNEIYATPRDEVYERIGVPVDIETPVVVDGSWRDGSKHTLQVGLGAILELIGNRVAPRHPEDDGDAIPDLAGSSPDPGKRSPLRPA